MILKGAVQKEQNIRIPHLNLEKKVKSVQIFKKDVNQATMGDRAGLLLTQFDSKLLERGFLCDSNIVIPPVELCIVSVKKIVYFKGTIDSKAKFHSITLLINSNHN